MNFQQVRNTEINEFLDRTRHWSREKFRRLINREHLQRLEDLKFPFPPGSNIADKKDYFTWWVRTHPKFMYHDPSESVELYAWHVENEKDPEW